MLRDMDVTLHVLSQVLNLGDDVLQIEVLVDDEHERIDFRIRRNLGHQRTVSELRTARSRRPVAGFVEVLVERIRVHYEALVLVADETDVRKRLSGFLEPLQIIDHLHENTGYLSLSLEVHVILVLEDDFQLLRRSSLRIDEAVTLERMRNLRLERFLEVLVVHIIDFPLFPASLHLFIELIATRTATGTEMSHTIRIKRRHKALLSVEEQVVLINLIVLVKTVYFLFHDFGDFIHNLRIKISLLIL